eukprot:jgi/Bigna1/134548/aug1.25_g9256
MVCTSSTPMKRVIEVHTIEAPRLAAVSNSKHDRRDRRRTIRPETTELKPLLRRIQKGRSHLRVLCAALRAALGWFCIAFAMEIIPLSLSSLEAGNDALFPGDDLRSSFGFGFFKEAAAPAAVLGALIAAPLCDWYGRRPPLVAGSVCISIGALWSSLAVPGRVWDVCIAR